MKKSKILIKVDRNGRVKVYANKKWHGRDLVNVNFFADTCKSTNNDHCGIKLNGLKRKGLNETKDAFIYEDEVIYNTLKE